MIIAPLSPTPNYALANTTSKQSELVCLVDSKKGISEELLCAAKTLSESEILDCQAKGKLDMNFTCDQFGTQNFHFISLNDSIYFELTFSKDLPSSFTDEDKALFGREEKIENGEVKDVWIYSFRHSKSELNSSVKETQVDIRTSKSGSYTLMPRRVLIDAHPETILISDLQEIIRQSTTLFYTGAGVSLASNIPGMDKLLTLFGIEEHSDFEPFFRDIIHEPLKLCENIDTFHQSCFFNQPSRAHYILKDIVAENNTQILTENLDCLHEQTGITPYRINAQKLKDEIDPESFNQIDYIICLGLSYDDRGFLAWYKKHHSNGKIIAVDLTQPSYLGDEDLFLKEDLQVVCECLSTF